MLAGTSMEVVLEMPFFPLSDADIRFAEKEKSCLGESYNVEAMSFGSPPRGYTIARLFGKACVNTESCVNAKTFHPHHEFRDFANLLTPDSAAEFSKW